MNDLRDELREAAARAIYLSKTCPDEHSESEENTLLYQLGTAILALPLPTLDWRIGMAVTPKLRVHPLYRQVGIVRRIFPATTSMLEHILVEVYQDGEVSGFDEPSDEWMTA